MNLADIALNCAMEIQQREQFRVTAEALWTRCAKLEAENKRLLAMMYPTRPQNVYDVQAAGAFQMQGLRTMLDNLPCYVDGKEDAHDALCGLEHAFNHLRILDECEIAERQAMADAERKNDEARDYELEDRGQSC